MVEGDESQLEEEYGEEEYDEEGEDMFDEEIEQIKPLKGKKAMVDDSVSSSQDGTIKKNKKKEDQVSDGFDKYGDEEYGSEDEF